MIISRTKRAFQVKLKTFFLVSRVLSFRHTKQISKNVADTTFKCSTNMILQFLADFFNDAYEHNTIATFRFTISAYHYLINGDPVGKEFLVTALLSGDSNNPGTHLFGMLKNYWFLDDFNTPKELNLKNLTQKLTMLVALTSAAKIIRNLFTQYEVFNETLFI